MTDQRQCAHCRQALHPMATSNYCGVRCRRDHNLLSEMPERQDGACPRCGSRVEQPACGRPKIYCSHACRISVFDKKRREAGTAPKRTRSRRVKPLRDNCEWCKTEFDRAHGKQRYCTKECQRLATRKKRECMVCGGEILNHSRQNSYVRGMCCSPECRGAYKASQALKKKIDGFGPPRTCRWCGVTFGYGGEAYKGWCSKSCRSEYAKDYERRLGHERRAKQASVTFERFSPTYILERDKYICQACGAKTKPNTKPTHPLYPNVDHIVPLSMGGEHSKKNCRCVCRTCNSKKCNRTLNDQLLLFG
jgi:hypothetical protein